MPFTGPTGSMHQLESNGGQRYFVSFDTSKDSVYPLPADEQERERLDTQGVSLNTVFDNKLIWAPLILKDGDTVLDSGTGSGHWVLTLAAQISPTINLLGIDLSPRMFPSPQRTPQNVTFRSLSITSLPMDWTNTLALVHQRLLIGGLQAHQWKAALSEMYRVLVPGGWVQLFEPDHIYCTPSEVIIHHKAIQIRDALCRDVCHTVFDVVSHLTNWLKEAGFVNVKIEKRGLPMGAWGGELGKQGLSSTIGAHHIIGEHVMRAGGLGFVKTREEYDAITEDFERLFEETPESYWQFWIFVAQKPATV